MWLYFWPSDHFVERGSPPFLLPAYTSGGVWLVSAALEISPVQSCESPYPMFYPEAGLISQTYLLTLTLDCVQMPTPSCGWETTGNDERCLGSRLDGYNIDLSASGNPPIPAGTHLSLQRPLPLENILTIFLILPT